MSNAYAIAAVTVTLRNILGEGVKDLTTNVTVLPLDKANEVNAGAQLNLFLYQVIRNASWANRDMPRQVKPGETGAPPLPLDLYYLITAYASANDSGKASDHALLGRAMQALHDHPVLSADDIKAATLGGHAPVPDSDLDQQIEHLRITQSPLSLDEVSKLWTSFSAKYRLSAAYQVGVTLIESARSARTPLPVLARGPEDAGFGSQPDLASPLPTLDALTPPKNQASVRLGEAIKLTGVHLDGTDVRLRFEHPRLPAPIESAPDLGATGTALKFTIPNPAPDWLAGFYTVTALVQRSGEQFQRTTNQLAMALAPTLTTISGQFSLGSIVGTRSGTITVTTAPDVQLGQRTALLLGDREIIFKSDPAMPAHTDTLMFDVADIPVGDYFVRLRVDGVDSVLVDKSTTPPTFDMSQQVAVT